MTASEQAKSMGLKSLAVVAEMTKQSPQTLDNWHKHKPELFDVVLRGCARKVDTNNFCNYLSGISSINDKEIKELLNKFTDLIVTNEGEHF